MESEGARVRVVLRRRAAGRDERERREAGEGRGSVEGSWRGIRPGRVRVVASS